MTYEEGFNYEHKLYTDAGVTKLEDMLALSKLNLGGGTAYEFANYGFKGMPEAMKKLNEFREAIPEYLQAGFHGDLDSMALLDANKDKVSPDSAVFLAEHGLKGRAKAMVDYFPLDLSRFIASNLGVMWGLSSFLSADYFHTENRFKKDTNNRDFKTGEIISEPDLNLISNEVENLRRKYATHFDIRTLYLLSVYDLGEHSSIIKDVIRTEGRKFVDRYAPYDPEKTYYEPQYTEQDLAKAYNFLKREGEEAFKKEYSLLPFAKEELKKRAEAKKEQNELEQTVKND
jgi:hypothetical protein